MAKGKRRSVLRGGRVLDAQAHRAAHKDILIDGDTITEVGPPRMPAPDEAVSIDARNRLLHPGLINAHTHGHGALMKGSGDRWTLELLLTHAPWVNGHRAFEDKALSTKIGAAEMVLKGCTACYDLHYEWPLPTAEGLDAIAGAYSEVGMRAVIAPMIADLSFYEAIPGLMDALPPNLRAEVEQLRTAPGRITLAAVRKSLKAWSRDTDQVRLPVAPTIPHHCSDRFMAACATLAREYGVGLHTHVSESKIQAITGMRRYGGTLTGHLDSLGLLGPDFTAAHAVWFDHDDMRRMAAQGASVAHNPGSNMRLGSGLADARAMLDRSVNVGIGTDGAQCADNQNMYEAMRLASFVSKVQSPDTGDWLTTEEVVEAATEGSARALGMAGKIGRLAPGYKADIVFLDLDHINWTPLNDPTNQLVHTEDGTAVDSVMIGGRMVVAGRRLTSVDTAKLSCEAEAARARLARANRDLVRLTGRLEKVVNSYCPGLARIPYHVHRYGANQIM